MLALPLGGCTIQSRTLPATSPGCGEPPRTTQVITNRDPFTQDFVVVCPDGSTIVTEIH